METMDQGDVIIRPSSKGENHLTVTWKVNDGIYQHVDVREEGKENAFSLGSTLWINTEVRAQQSMPGRRSITYWQGPAGTAFLSLRLLSGCWGGASIVVLHILRQYSAFILFFSPKSVQPCCAECMTESCVLE